MGYEQNRTKKSKIEKAGEDKHSKFPQSCNLDTIKMYSFFSPKGPCIILAALYQDKASSVYIYTTQPPAFTSLSTYPKLYIIAPISVGIVCPYC